jgi:hypothetical protein
MGVLAGVGGRAMIVEFQVKTLRYWTLAIAMLVAGGCNTDGRRPVAPVSGTVTYDGNPVAGATVIFLSNSGEPAATGITAADGTFRLSTYGEADGAVPGSYAVTVTKLEGGASNEAGAPFDPVADMEAAARNTAPPPPARHLLPEKYAAAVSSPLKFTVEAAGGNRFAIELTDEQ